MVGRADFWGDFYLSLAVIILCFNNTTTIRVFCLSIKDCDKQANKALCLFLTHIFITNITNQCINHHHHHQANFWPVLQHELTHLWGLHHNITHSYGYSMHHNKIYMYIRPGLIHNPYRADITLQPPLLRGYLLWVWSLYTTRTAPLICVASPNLRPGV